MTQDPSIGVVSREDLVEGLRVNRALLASYHGDISCHQSRLAGCRERIAFQETLMAEWNHLAEVAPERVVAVEARIVLQERQLAALREAVPSPRVAKADQIEVLLNRIKQGDMAAVTELQKLL